MREMKTNGHATVEVKKHATVVLKSTKTPHLYSVSYQNEILGHVDTNDTANIRFIPLPEKKVYSIVELEKVTLGLKKARQMQQQIINTIESFLN